MISLSSHTEGLNGLGLELLEQTADDVRPLIARAGQKLVELARKKLDVLGGPSRPGEPPAKETGALQDSIGRTGPFTRPGTVELAWGVGVGDEATARVAEWKSKGINVFEYAKLLEEGGTGADGRRYPPRPYIRSTESELEAQLESDIEAGL